MICLIILSVIVSAVSCDEEDDASGTGNGTDIVEDFTAEQAAEYLNGKNDVLLSVLCDISEKMQELPSEDYPSLMKDNRIALTVKKKGLLFEDLDSIVMSDGIFAVSGSRLLDSGKKAPYKDITVYYEEGVAKYGTFDGRTTVQSYSVNDKSSVEIDLSGVEKALKISKHDLKETDKNGEFRVASGYAYELALALCKSVKINGGELPNMTELLPEKSKIDIHADITEHKKDILYITVSVDTLSLKLKIDFSGFDGENGSISCATVSDASEGGISFDVSLSAKKITYIRLDASISTDDGSVRAALLLSDTALGFTLELSKEGEVLFLIDANAEKNQSKTEMSFKLKIDGSLNEDGDSGGLVPLSAFTADGSNGDIEITGALSIAYEGESVVGLLLECNGSADGYEFSISLNTDAKKAKIKGEIALTGKIDVKSPDGSMRSTVEAVTVNYSSDKEATYTLTVSGTDFDGKSNEETLELCISDSVKAELTAEEQDVKNGFAAFLRNPDRATNMLNTYIERLENQYNRAGNVRLHPNKDYFFVKDEKGSFYYLINVEVINGKRKYSAGIGFVRSELDYYYSECGENMAVTVESKYWKDYDELLNAESNLDEGYYPEAFPSCYVFKYVKEIDAYMIVNSVIDYLELISEDPSAQLRANGEKFHELRYDSEGRAYAHAYSSSYDENCHHSLVCEECGYHSKSKRPIHSMKDTIVLREGDAENSRAEFSMCENCMHSEITLKYSDGCKVVLTCDGASLEKINLLTDVIGLPRYTEKSIKNCLVVKSIRLEASDSVTRSFSGKTVDIPDISMSGYTLIALSGYSEHSYQIYDLRLVLPEGLVFITDGCLAPMTLPSGGLWKEIVFPSSVRYIDTIGDNMKMEEITFPEGLLYFGGFDNARNLKRITVDSKNLLSFKVGKTPVLESVRFNGKVKELWGFSSGAITEFTIPEGCETVYGFENNSTLRSVTIPASVKVIGSEAFRSCTALEKVIFKGTFIKKIGDRAFGSCPLLESVTLPTVEAFGLEVFSYSMGLTEVEFTGNTKRIGNGMFNMCKSLQSVKFPNGLTEIGTQAFYYTALKTVVLPDSVEIIGINAFSECKVLEYVKLSKSIVSIGENAFSNCEKLYFEELKLDGTVKSVGNRAFAKIKGIGKVTLGGSIETLGSDIFDDTPVAELYSDCPNVAP